MWWRAWKQACHSLFNRTEIMIQEHVQEFNDAVNITFQVPISGIFTTALIHFNTAPTTAGDLLLTFKSTNGENYDTVLHTVDPSNPGITDIAYSPSTAIAMNKGDKILLTYPNANKRRVNVTLKGLDSANF